MSDNSAKRTIPEELKVKMQAAAKAAREKRKADEEANPQLREERLARNKAKRDAKKKTESDDGENTSSSDKPKKERKKLSPEAQAAATAKRKATLAAKKEVKVPDTVKEDSENSD